MERSIALDEACTVATVELPLICEEEGTDLFMETEEVEISGPASDVVVYGYSVLDYARQYDRSWIRQLERLCKAFPTFTANSQFYLHKELLRQQRRRRYQPNRFPTETVSVWEVLSYLDAATLLQATQVCVLWRDLANNNSHWQQLLRSQYQLSCETLVLRRQKQQQELQSQHPLWAKEMYRQMYLSFQALMRNDNAFKERPTVPLQLLQGGILSH